MKTLWRFLCLCFVLLFSGCKPSGNTGKGINGEGATAGSTLSKTVSPAERKKREARLKWNMDTLVGDYNKKGTRNSKWDRVAKEALVTFARVRAYGPEQVRGFPTNVAALANEAVRAGCSDP